MAEQQIEVNGGMVAYEFVGREEGEVVVLTPGGRFSKDYGGVHELADALAAGGKRVLLWDRPNCGKSDVQFYGQSESHMRSETLSVMLDKLGIKQVIAAGGSGGARDMIIFTIMYPKKVRKLITWCIVGGSYSTMLLANVYIINELRTVRRQGMQGVLEMGAGPFGWKACIEANPRNRQRLLDMGAERFEEVMLRWLDAFIPKPNEAIPGVPDYQFAGIKVPTLIVRGGAKDYDHPPRTSFEVHALIKGSRLIEPPWPEDAWEVASAASQEGKGSAFDFWHLGAPDFLKFIDE
jgi:2-hydroxy-6-oxonona-2,4-dienedioate hydrolase